MDKFILTNYKTYTPEEVVDLFSEYVLPSNVEVLVNHLSIEELAEGILSFTEIDGDIHLNIGVGELIKITKK